MTHVVQMIPGIDRIGGAEREVLLLAQGMVRRGFRVTVIALSGEGGDAAVELKSAGVGFVSLGMRKGLADPRGWLRMRRWLLQNKPDVVHAHLPHAAWMARLARLIAPVRVVVDTVHTSSSGTATRRFLYRVTAPFTDCVTAVSQGAADACHAAGMSPARPIQVLPNGTDIEEWSPCAQAGTRAPDPVRSRDDFLWLAVGRLEPVKNYPLLLSAFAGLPDTCRLTIAGAGPLEHELRRLCCKIRIDSRVELLGNRNDVRHLMQTANAFVLASNCEGLPMSLLEAGACGLPSVATAVAGSSEVVVDGETGYLTRPGDMDSLRRAMLRLMEMAPANRYSMGLNARQKIVQEFSLQSVLDRWERLYNSLLDSRPLAARWGRTCDSLAERVLRANHSI